MEINEMQNKNILLEPIIKEIGGVTYIVEREFSIEAKETFYEKLKRIIMQEIEIAALR